MREHNSKRVKEENTEELLNIEEKKTEKRDDEEERLRLDEENEREDLRKTEMRIKELQSSIMSLDWQLERTQIEKMKKKTEKVQKRMSLSLSTDHWDFV